MVEKYDCRAYLSVDDLVDGHLEVVVPGGRAHVAPPPEALLAARAAPLRALHVLVHLRGRHELTCTSANFITINKTYSI